MCEADGAWCRYANAARAKVWRTISRRRAQSAPNSRCEFNPDPEVGPRWARLEDSGPRGRPVVGGRWRSAGQGIALAVEQGRNQRQRYLHAPIPAAGRRDDAAGHALHGRTVIPPRRSVNRWAGRRRGSAAAMQPRERLNRADLAGLQQRREIVAAFLAHTLQRVSQFVGSSLSGFTLPGFFVMHVGSFSLKRLTL
jgi:hypothetical protein